MPWPNFLIVGAQKAGTSTLYRAASAHPQVFMSKIKEPKYFAVNGDGCGFKGPFLLPDSVACITDKHRYLALFEAANRARALGEASTWYLHSEIAPEKISSVVPEMKIIAVLRDPVERAYSNYLHARNYLEIEPLDSFEAALAAEKERVKQDWGHPWYYLQKGFYFRYLQRYYDRFPRSRIKIFLTKDLSANPKRVIRDMYAFLGVDEDYQPDFSKRYNVSPSRTRSMRLHQFLDNPHRFKRVLKPLIPEELRRWTKLQIQKRNRVRNPVSPETRRELIAVFRKDILQLQELIDRDLSHWLEAR